MCISLPSNKKGYSYLHITSCQHCRLTPCTYSSIGNRVWHPGRARLLHSLGNQTPIRVWLITQDGCNSPHPLTGCGLHVPLLGIGCRSPTTHQYQSGSPTPNRVWLLHLLGCPICPFQGFPNCPFQGFPNCPFQGTSPPGGFSQLPFSG